MVTEPHSSYVNIPPSCAHLDIPWSRINQTIGAHRLKDNHMKYIRRCSEWNVHEYIVPDWCITAFQELDGWRPPKSAIRGFHRDNDINTLNLLVERGRVNEKVRGRGKRLYKVNYIKKVSGSARSYWGKLGTYRAMFDIDDVGMSWNESRYYIGLALWHVWWISASGATSNSRRPHLPYDTLPCQ